MNSPRWTFAFVAVGCVEQGGRNSHSTLPFFFRPTSRSSHWQRHPKFATAHMEMWNLAVRRTAKKRLRMTLAGSLVRKLIRPNTAQRRSCEHGAPILLFPLPLLSCRKGMALFSHRLVVAGLKALYVLRRSFAYMHAGWG